MFIINFLIREKKQLKMAENCKIHKNYNFDDFYFIYYTEI